MQPDNRNKRNHIVLVAILCSLASAFAVQEPTTGLDDCNFPRLVEFIQNFTLSAGDVQYFIDKNMSQFDLTSIGTSRTTLFENIRANVTYDGSGKQVTPLTNTSWSIKNDGLIIVLTLTAKVYHITGSGVYNLQISSQKIPISYTKVYDQASHSFSVKDAKIEIDSKLFSITKADPTIKQTDKQKINTLMTNDLVAAIVKNFVSFNSELDSNARKEVIGNIYLQKSYKYQFQNTYFTFDMSTKTLQIDESNQSTTVTNGITGSIDGLSQQLCPLMGQNYKQNFTEFISLEFIRNLANYGVAQYDPWKQLLINQSWVRTRVFQFRLVDLEFVMDSKIYDKYAQFYMSPVYLTCGIKQLNSLYLDDKLQFIHSLVTWSCKGYINTTASISGDNPLILDFEPQIDHQVELWIIGGNQIAAYSNVLKTIGIKYNQVQDFSVVNQQLLKVYMDDMFNDFRTYVFGTRFIIKDGSTKIKYQPDSSLGSGIWIG